MPATVSSSKTFKRNFCHFSLIRKGRLFKWNKSGNLPSIQTIIILVAKDRLIIFLDKTLMKKTLLVITVFLCSSLNLLCAQNQIKGTLKNEKGYPVSHATVAIEGTPFGTTSNEEGVFILHYKESENQILKVFALSAMDTSIEIDKIKNKNNLKITLLDKPFKLSEVVVTGTGTHSYLKDSPIHTQVFTQKEIINSGSTSLEDILRNMNSSITYSESHGIVASGFSGRNILILVDGNKLNGDTSGQTDIERLDMSKIKRIEVVRGSASALYGSEAMGGVINIITQNPTDDISVTTTNKISRKGQFFSSSVVEIKNKKFTSQTSYQRRQTDGWQLSPYEWTKKWNSDGTPQVKPTDKQAVTGYYSDNVRQKFTFTPIPKLTFNATGTYYNKKQKRKEQVPSYKYNMHYKDYNVGAGAIYRLPKKLGSISLNTYFDNYEYEKDYFKDDKKILAGESTLSKRQRYSNTDLKGAFRLGNHKLSTGINFTNDYLKNPEKLDHSKSAYTLSLYAQDEMKFFKSLSVIAGFRALHHKEFKNRFVPSLSTMYAWEHFNVRLSYAGGFRAPDLMELYYNNEGMGGGTVNHSNPNLKPEKSNSFTFSTEYFNKYFTISASTFITFIDDIIQRVSVDEQYPHEGDSNHYQYQNLNRARSRGFDLGIQALLISDLSLGINYSYLDARNMNPSKNPDVRDKYLNGSSRHTGSVNMNYAKHWEKYKLNVNFNGHLQSSAFYENMNARAYSLWNIITTHTIKGIKHFTPTLSVGVDNVFNFRDTKPFLMRYATTSPGRSFFASLTLKLNK